MQQEFRYHALNRAQSAPARAERLADAATAYVTLVTVAVAAALVTMAFAANLTVRWLDAVVKPAYFSGEITPQKGLDAAPAPRGTFAMLPASVPPQMKDEVITSNF
jgi:hypothetical protein